MAKLFIHGYMKGSGSVKGLKEALGATVIKREGSKFKGAAGKTVLNWGCSSLPPEVMKCRVINNPAAVALAANKLHAFRAMDELVNIPEFTTDRATAEGWINDGGVCVCRQKLTGHSGEGIVIAENLDEMVNAPLYVKYIKKNQEYRVHVFNGEVMDVQRKARKADVPDDAVNWQVRNLAGGFIFAREGFEPPAMALEESVAAVDALGLDFGAVDVIYNDREGQAYVIEVNCAPGLTGTTLDNYAAAIGGVL